MSKKQQPPTQPFIEAIAFIVAGQEFKLSSSKNHKLSHALDLQHWTCKPHLTTSCSMDQSKVDKAWAHSSGFMLFYVRFWVRISNYVYKLTLILGRPKAGRDLRLRLWPERVCCRQNFTLLSQIWKELDFTY